MQRNSAIHEIDNGLSTADALAEAAKLSDRPPKDGGAIKLLRDDTVNSDQNESERPRILRCRAPPRPGSRREREILDRGVPQKGAAFAGLLFKSTGVELNSSEQREQSSKHSSTSRAIEHSDCYIPPVQISNRLVTKKLIKVAQEFTFLDHFFADCFGAFEEASNHVKIRQDLIDIRDNLGKCQRQSSGRGNKKAIYIGTLGEFCEDVCSSWEKPSYGQKMKVYKNGLKYGKDYMAYLQDTLEIPYWQLVIDLLLDWRERNTSNTLGTAILYMLQYKALSCRNRVEELAQMAVPDEEDGRGLAIMQRSIQKRLDVLDEALEVEMLDEDLGVKAAILDVSDVRSETGSGGFTARHSTRHDASMQLAIFVFFIILAFIPGYQSFAISAKTHENGSTGDADFFNLMQSSIMSVLGNFATALPLLQSGRFSGPSHFFWVFSALGLFSAVLSVIIYPLANTGWSSMVCFISNVASAASVLVLTIATAREQMSGPVLSRSHGEHPTKGYAGLNEKKKQ